jgi:D-arabinose 1-dehydrogenase-like Zn-dependent alcohol dehydrogenase
MHAYHGKDSRREAPLIFGHEVSGTIESGDLKGKKSYFKSTHYLWRMCIL